MSRGPDAETLLRRALEASAEAAGCPVTLAESDWARWASATFTGARHLLALTAPPSPALDAWIAALPEAELRLRGHLVADLVVEHVRRAGDSVRVSLEVLTVEQRE
ncbi:hypothetical protein P6144_11655 [Sphingomonas sp. HITSZ_GF]|uniref:hypothetical protein n=1 Tax=Sphingomonas sp. HITSZ_GF TaxID=3037247 RepID=UPI00240E54CD|nr:hypothetical protein [Sphingomonas sp. HITSZ_GF]MDG2534307.1 hypothetical protein [Sphingomonas sp. HITSZ_GF]